MAEEPEITAEDLATCRRCTFARRVFASYPTLRAKKPLGHDDLPPDSRDGPDWHLSKPYTGEPFDPDEYELIEGGWDHEHCDVCRATITDDMPYWPNVGPEGGHVDLCEACHPRVRARLDGTSTTGGT